ncbi:MAG: transcriptional regulator with XRE-family HTH domain [Spirosomataceae bacterium]|jgi:transcriptional regulator with XRE-family HTH domain
MFDEQVKIKDVKTEIGQFVRVIRKRHDLTQEELAQLLNISRITVQNLEAGKNFTIDTLLKVLEHFDLLKELNTLVKDKRSEQENVISLY